MLFNSRLDSMEEKSKYINELEDTAIKFIQMKHTEKNSTKRKTKNEKDFTCNWSFRRRKLVVEKSSWKWKLYE